MQANSNAANGKDNKDFKSQFKKTFSFGGLPNILGEEKLAKNSSAPNVIKPKTHSKEYLKRQNRMIDIKAKRMDDKKYKEQLEAALLQARKDIAENKSEWKEIAAEMTTTLKKNKRLSEVLQKTVEMFEFADMVQIGKNQENPDCEYCKGLTQITEIISNI